MKSSVIVFPGSNCDRDVAVALKKFKIKNEMVWHLGRYNSVKEAAVFVRKTLSSGKAAERFYRAA